MSDLIERLQDRLTLKFVADCKCGSCQCVPAAALSAPAFCLGFVLAIVAVLAKAEKARVLDYCMSAVDAFTDGDLGKARELLEKIISVDGDGAKLPALVSDSDDDDDEDDG